MIKRQLDNSLIRKPRVSMIAAIGNNDRAIGKDNDLLWHISEDLKYFKKMTSGHPVIMGRKTFESFGAKPLPNRTNIIVTRNTEYRPEGVVTAHSLEDAITKASMIDQDEIFNIGGAQTYTQGLELADRLYLTLVNIDIEGDTHFPEYPEFTNVVSEESGSNDEFNWKWVILEKEIHE